MLADQRRSRPAHVTVLGSFTATSPTGASVPLGADGGRVVAYLAVHRQPQRRATLAAALHGGPAAAALGLLDGALAAPGAAGLLAPDDAAGTLAPLALASSVEVDLDEAMALVRTLIGSGGRPDAVPADVPAAIALLGADILPDEPATWVAVERERFRQIRLNALEELSAALGAAGRHAEAVALAEEIVRTAPSRESARRALIEAHLAQGEIAEAVAQYDEYQELLRSSVGAAPTFGLEGLLPPVPAWPVLRVRRSMQRIDMSPPGLRGPRPARRLVLGGSAPGVR